jgi:hypothetical protein
MERIICMPKKLIQVRHHMCDYSCMWNGIEDIFITKTGEDIPPFFFFCLSGVGNAVYLRHRDEKLPRLLMFGDGRPHKIYGNISEIVGFEYRFVEGRTFSYAFKRIKDQIDIGRPVVIGPVDMFHLPYLKMYHKVHIPIHYILMVGYDDERQCIYVYDCGREEIQTVPFDELKKAWEIEKTTVGDRNGFIEINFADEIKSTYEIADTALKKKAKEMLEPQASFTGIKGIRKAAKEFSAWKNELTPEGYKNSLRNMLEFIGTVPKLPNIVMGIEEPEDEGIHYEACRDKMGTMLIMLGETYQSKKWKEAGTLFLESGKRFREIADIIIEYFTKGEDKLGEIPVILGRIADLEEEAYELCMKCIP